MEKKEAMKILKDFHDKSALFSVRTALDTIIPELRESEDEKIRKEIIKFLELPHRQFVGERCQEEWIAWLEKQKEYELPEDLGDYIAELNKQFPEVSFAKLSRIAVRVKNWLKKQSEQKPTDKVEPKFQNGQWIVWQNKCYKVNYNGCGYELIDQNGLSTSLEYGTVDKSAHLWTIQDAKDGDVLQLGVVTVIFQEYICNGNCKCYCSVYNGEFEIPTKDESYGTFNATPATKEQRDTLEKAITNAGYRWDKEKLKLEKI